MHVNSFRHFKIGISYYIIQSF